MSEKWEEEFDKQFGKITSEGGFIDNEPPFETNSYAIKKFIRTLLAEQAKRHGEIEEGK